MGLASTGSPVRTISHPQASRKGKFASANQRLASAIPSRSYDCSAEADARDSVAREVLPRDRSQGNQCNGKARSLIVSTAIQGLVLPALAEELTSSSGYVPSPYNPGWEVWIGFAAGVIPFLIGGYEFTKRIVIQQRCERCKGSGLVPKRDYKTERDLRKCPDCGGFFPWQGWGRFFTSTALPGNGGPLMAPKGQSSVFYEVPRQRKEVPDSCQQAGKEAEKRGD